QAVDDGHAGKNLMRFTGENAEHVFGVVDSIGLAKFAFAERDHRVAGDNDAFRVLSCDGSGFANGKLQNFICNRTMHRHELFEFRSNYFEGQTQQGKYLAAARRCGSEDEPHDAGCSRLYGVRMCSGEASGAAGAESSRSAPADAVKLRRHVATSAELFTRTIVARISAAPRKPRQYQIKCLRMALNRDLS